MRARVVAYVLTLIAAVYSLSMGGEPESTESGPPMTVDELLETIGPTWSIEAYYAKQRYRFGTEMKPESWEMTPGVVNLQVTIWSDDINDYTGFQVEVAEHDGLRILGPLLRVVEIQPGDSDIVVIPVEIAPNDTGRVRVLVSTERATLNHAATLIADTVRVAYGNGWADFEGWKALHDSLRHYPTAKERNDSIKAERERIFKELEDGPRVGRSVLGKDGKWYNLDSLPPDFEVWSEPKDTGRIWSNYIDDTTRCWARNEEGEWVRADRDSLMRVIEEQKIERQWSRLRAKEQQPCMVDAEVMTVDGKDFVRRKGEVKFHEARPMPDGRIPADSMKYYRAPSRFHVVVDLSKPGDSAAIAEIVDSLVPFDPAHLYHFEVDRMQMQEVENSGVPYNFYPYEPVRGRDGTESLPADDAQGSTDGAADSDAGGQLVSIFTSDFESGLPWQWEAYDSDAQSGFDYWGIASSSPVWAQLTGDSSLWCAAIGEHGAGQYDNSMNAEFRPVSPLAVSEYDRIFICYDYYVYTWDFLDYFAWSRSWDGMVYYPPEGTVTGMFTGWDSVSTVIDCGGRDTLYHSFSWISDHADIGGFGAYVDNVAIYGELPPKPNLRCCDLAYCTQPICIDPWAGDTVFVGEQFNIDFAISNQGDTTASAFWVDVILDDQMIGDWYFPDIDAGECDEVTGMVTAIVTADESHAVRIEIDPADDVDEESEADNSCETNLWAYDRPDLAPREPISATPRVAGEPTQFTYRFWNESNATTGPFQTRLLLDGATVIGTYTCPGLGAYQRDTVEVSYTVPMPPDSHTLEVQLDYTGQVYESNENNNTLTATRYWSGPTVAAQGTVMYWQQRAGAPLWWSADSFYVEMRDADSSGPGDLLDSGWTFWGGGFLLGGVENSEEDGTRQDVFIRVYARRHNVRVGDPAAAPTYDVTPLYFDSDTITNADHGTLCWDWSCIGLPIEIAAEPSGAYFYAAKCIAQGHEAWDTIAPGLDIGITDVVFTSNDSLATGYSDTKDLIYILDTLKQQSGSVDRWSRGSYLHEFSHRIADRIGFFNQSSGGGHQIWEMRDAQFASSEGWAYFCPSLVSADRRWAVLYGKDLDDTLYLDNETGEYGLNGLSGSFVFMCLGARGPENGASVSNILWDIYDSGNDDWYIRSDWYDSTCNGNYNLDNVGDNLSDGTSNITHALTQIPYSGHLPYTMREIYQIWCDSALGSARALWDIYYEHGDSFQARPTRGECSCCLARGDIDNDGGGPDISDLVFVGTYMFSGGPQPPCLLAADVDGDGGVPDISDLVYLVTWMFSGGPPAVPCGDGPPVMVADSISKGAMLTAE